VIISNVTQLIKDQPLAQIGPTHNVREACKVMCELDVGAVVVLDNEALVGVLSERDVIRKCTCLDRHTAETSVAEIMTENPKTVNYDDSLAVALEIMSTGGFHHVPVLQQGKTIGLISSDDIPEEYRMMLERFKEIRGGGLSPD
jgi:CBS domain-containing protein